MPSTSHPASTGLRDRLNTALSKTLILTTLLLVTPLSETMAQSGQRTDFARFGDWLWQDARAGITGFGTSELGLIAGSTIFLAATSIGDESVSTAATHWGGGATGSVLDSANELGGPYGLLIPISLFGVSLTSHNTKFQDAAFTSLQAYVYANTIVLMMKMAVGRSRPNAGQGAHDFNPFSGAASFPSGHTSSVFAMVMPWVFYYPGPITFSMMGVAALTAMSRLEKQKHWFTDVMAGAAISSAVSHFLFRQHRDAQSGAADAMVAPGLLSMRISIPI